MDSNFSKEFFEKIVLSSPESILVTDADGVILYVTRNRLANTDKEHLVGENIHDLVEQGYLKESSTVDALASKKTVSKYLSGRFDHVSQQVYSVSVPWFNEKGELEYVFAYSTEEEYIVGLTAELDLHKNVVQYLTNNGFDQETPVAKDAHMLEIFESCKLVAATDGTILLLGETGTGKEVLARYIHKCSRRANNQFIAVNCATIPKDLMEAEFFGYAPGSFTGADKNGKPGLFELANGGTLFLDEVAELTLPMQSALLRALESGEVRRIGAQKTQHVDVRIISATKENLEEAVEKYMFRNDLFYRLSVVPIKIPPLRERKDDIRMFAQLFLEKYNHKYHSAIEIPEESLKNMEEYHWPGNVRELRNTIERMVITKKASFCHSAGPSAKSKKTGKVQSFDHILPLKKAAKKYEQEYLLEVYNFFNKDIVRTALHLEIHPSSLYRKLSEIQPEKGP